MMNYIKRSIRYISSHGHRFLYFGPLIIASIIWGLAINSYSPDYDYTKYWSSGLTMVVGSFFSGSTPIGGGAVAFPVLTKLLDIQVEDARTFSLAIQSVGMTFATLYFMSRKIWIDWKLIFISLPGSSLGLYLGNRYLDMNGDIVKLIFTEFVVLTAFLYFYSKNIASATHSQVAELRRLLLFANVFSFIGGLIVSKIGCGADVALFFVLVFLLGNDAKKSTPTTVAFMAINSLVALYIVVPVESVSDFVFGSWLVSAPVVAIGAPVGGWVLNKLSLRRFEVLLIFAFSFEVISSLVFSSMHLASRGTIFLSVVFCLSLMLNRSGIIFSKIVRNRALKRLI